MNRQEGRRPDQLRSLEIVVDYLEQPLGSVLYSQGKTRVLCTASLDERIPRWLRELEHAYEDRRRRYVDTALDYPARARLRTERGRGA